MTTFRSYTIRKSDTMYTTSTHNRHLDRIIKGESNEQEEREVLGDRNDMGTSRDPNSLLLLVEQRLFTHRELCLYLKIIVFYTSKRFLVQEPVRLVVKIPSSLP